MTPSALHELLAFAIPRARRAQDVTDPDAERARVEAWHRDLDRSLPTALVPGFSRRVDVRTETLAPGFDVHTLLPRRVGSATPRRTLYYVHGGGFMAPIDAAHVRYGVRLARALDARLVLPDYPLAPEHTWRDSHDLLVEHASHHAAGPGGIVLAGDSAGGGLALALALALRDRGTSPTHLLLHAPWVDLTTSTPETEAFDAIDPWLFLGKVRLYAEWWAGSTEDLGRPEVSPALADLAGLPPALMFYGTKDLLAPGCRLLARRAREAGWDLTAVEEADLIHVFSIMPALPEARRAWHRTLEFLR